MPEEAEGPATREPGLGAEEQAQGRERGALRVFYVQVRLVGAPPPGAAGVALLSCGAPPLVVLVGSDDRRSTCRETHLALRWSEAGMVAGLVGEAADMGRCTDSTRLTTEHAAEAGRSPVGDIQVAGGMEGLRYRRREEVRAGRAARGEESVQAGVKRLGCIVRSHTAAAPDTMRMDKRAQAGLRAGGTYNGCRTPSGTADARSWRVAVDSTGCRGF